MPVFFKVALLVMALVQSDGCTVASKVTPKGLGKLTTTKTLTVNRSSLFCVQVMKEVNTIFTQTNLIIAKQSYESCITILKLDTATYNRLQEKYEDSKTTLDKARQDFEAEIQVRKRFLTNILGCGMALLRHKHWQSDIMPNLSPVVHEN